MGGGRLRYHSHRCRHVSDRTAADFRKHTPLVLMRALRVASTEVCEPIETFNLDMPEDTTSAVSGALVNARDDSQRVL